MPSFSAVKRSSNRQEQRLKPSSKPRTPSSDSDSKSRSPVRSSTIQNYLSSDDWTPSIPTALKLLLSARLSAAFWSCISDCDEVFNYWEPAHLMLYGTGLQTWEYSPEYAIRSYAYVWVYAFPAAVLKAVAPSLNKLSLFYLLRIAMGVLSACVEVFFYRTVCERYSKAVGRLMLGFLLMSSGMFVASCAFLPSSFAMVANVLAMTLWMRGRMFEAVFVTGCSALVGWPFAAVLGAPIVLDVFFGEKHSRLDRMKRFFLNTLMSAASIGTLLIKIDSYYYGRSVLAPLNIVLYNVFSKHGPSLYGVEPPSFYLWNGMLNFNIVFPLAMISLPVSAAGFYAARRKKQEYWPVFCLLVPMYLWMGIFVTQPHKEERFLFPIYPLICIAAALCVESGRVLVEACFRSGWIRKSLKICTGVSLGIFFILSLSRSYALYRNYHAPLDVYLRLHDLATENPRARTVCVGKEWYRFPSSFFLPDGWRLGFVRSGFRGLLPRPFASLPIPDSTRKIPQGMNDQNKEELSAYTDLARCDFLVDFDEHLSEQRDLDEPNYVKMKEWEQVFQAPFLISAKSNRVLRAFYIPWLSESFCEYGEYTLLRKRTER